MSTIPDPDPEQDFDGFITGTLDEMLRELAAIPEEQHLTHFLSQSAARLHRLVKMNAPAWILENEKRILQRRAASLPVYCADYVPPSDDNTTPKDPV